MTEQKSGPQDDAPSSPSVALLILVLIVTVVPAFALFIFGLLRML